MKAGKGLCHGTFGELAQGMRGKVPFLFTLPIGWKSKAVFYPWEQPEFGCSDPSKRRAVLACKKTAEFLGVSHGGFLHIQSNIPVGKGMASSSADIVASIRAAADAFQTELPSAAISKIAADIEATDGVMYEGIVAYNYVYGELIEAFGPLKDLLVLGFDPGGRVETQGFTNGKDAYCQKELEQFNEIFAHLCRGLKERDYSAIFQASTLSSKINQRLLPKPYFDLFEEIAQNNGWGIAVAHSGTVIGLLMDQREEGSRRKVKESARYIQQATGWKPCLFSAESISEEIEWSPFA